MPVHCAPGRLSCRQEWWSTPPPAMSWAQAAQQAHLLRHRPARQLLPMLAAAARRWRCSSMWKPRAPRTPTLWLKCWQPTLRTLRPAWAAAAPPRWTQSASATLQLQVSCGPPSDARKVCLAAFSGVCIELAQHMHSASCGPRINLLIASCLALQSYYSQGRSSAAWHLPLRQGC